MNLLETIAISLITVGVAVIAIIEIVDKIAFLMKVTYLQRIGCYKMTQFYEYDRGVAVYKRETPD